MAGLTYYVAATLDGFIAHEDGSFDGFEWDDEIVSDFFADLGRATHTKDIHLDHGPDEREEVDDMTKADSLLPEFEKEMEATRRVIERVPDDNPDWKPHPKSFSIAHLAQLLSWMPGWIGQTLTSTELDLAGGGGYSNESTESLLQMFDENVRAAREAITAAKDSDFDVPWSLKMNGKVLFTLPRGAVVRQHISHLSHHRGQMTVYLRMLDVPVPSIYGPSADEPWDV